MQCIPYDRRVNIWKNISDLEATIILEGKPATKTGSLPDRKKMKFVFSTGTDIQSTSCSSMSEIDVYRSLPEMDDDYSDPLQWWKLHEIQLPSLALISKRFLLFPATSVPSERVFSVAGITVNKLRSSLKPENVNMLICLKSWLQ